MWGRDLGIGDCTPSLGSHPEVGWISSCSLPDFPSRRAALVRGHGMILEVSENHFLRAAREIGKSGENDTLPYDPDARFIKESAEVIAKICKCLFDYIEAFPTDDDAKGYVNSLEVFSERLLTPAGAHGFRIVTRIQPFWNVYLNGLGIAIAESVETRRSGRVYSYRVSQETDRFFDHTKSWRHYKESTVAAIPAKSEKVIVQTDISSFYERIYHHRLENILSDLAGRVGRLPLQIDRTLAKMSSGRSFGLPVGGQCSRVLAEVMMMPIDETLTQEGLDWHRYVDDFTLVTDSHQEAYRALSVLSHALADYGLSLNRTKTTIMRSNHYVEYIRAQLGEGADSSTALRELDLHFDPYSDNALTEYKNLQETVAEIDFEFLLNLEKEKSQPDSFIIAQISRALQYQDPQTAANLCATLLEAKNLDAFRASWSKIMRGVYGVRANVEFADAFSEIDRRLDDVPGIAPHLLLPEVNVLHYLRILRFQKTERRAQFVRRLFEETRSITVKRACIDCWQAWVDMPNFTRVRNQWAVLSPEVQRMLWLAAGRFGDDGQHARQQLKRNALQSWALGIEPACNETFADVFVQWARNA
jgi:hypothetical protein